MRLWTVGIQQSLPGQRPTLMRTAACTMMVSYTSKASKYSFRNEIATNAERAVLMDRKISWEATSTGHQSRCSWFVAAM